MTRSIIQRAHCNQCGHETKHQRLFDTTKRYEEPAAPDYNVVSEETYEVLECRGCESVKLLHRSWFSEYTDDHGQPIEERRYYPPAEFRQAPHWLHILDNESAVTKLLSEIYRALQNDAPALAAMGIRACVEAVMIDKVGDLGNFRKIMKEFQSQGFVSNAQRAALDAVIEIGHATIHRTFRPTAHQLETAIDVLENLVHTLYVIEIRAVASAAKVPRRGA